MAAVIETQLPPELQPLPSASLYLLHLKKAADLPFPRPLGRTGGGGGGGLLALRHEASAPEAGRCLLSACINKTEDVHPSRPLSPAQPRPAGPKAPTRTSPGRRELRTRIQGFLIVLEDQSKGVATGTGGPVLKHTLTHTHTEAADSPPG